MLMACACAYNLQAPASQSVQAPVVRRALVAPSMILGLGEVEGKTPANVGEAKLAFNAKYGRPVNGMQQGFVNEMLTAVTLALVTKSYQPSRVFYLGVDSLCKTFLEGVADEEAEKLFVSLCAGVGFDPKKMQAEAEKLTEFAKGKTEEELFAGDDLSLIVSAGNFKYSYPLGAGVLALMPLVDVEPTDEAIARWSEKLALPASRLQKDWAYFKDAQEKIVQAKQMMMEMAAAGKRKEAAKLKEEAEKAAAEATEAEEAVSAD